jgi:hypothetical protein
MRKSSKAVKASEGIDLSTKCAIIENKETSVRKDIKTDTFEAALKALSDCYRAKEQQLADILADNKRSHEVFEAMNADYVVKNDELAKLKSEIDDIAQTKKELKQRVPHILDLLVSHLLDALMEYTQAPVSIESTNEFKSKMLSVIMDTQQSIKNVLPK